MPLVTELSFPNPDSSQRIPVQIDRYTLGKRRWRTAASDGTDIAVDLEKPCRNGDIVLRSGGKTYFIKQAEESVIRIPIPQDGQQAARLGWVLGNQHLQIEIKDHFIFLAFDKPLIEKLGRLGLEVEQAQAVFSPDPHSRVHHHH